MESLNFLNNKSVLERRISKGTVLKIFGAHIEKALSPYVLVLQNTFHELKPEQFFFPDV